MSQQGQWQVAGSAPEVYERELVPAVFGVWAPILVELAQPCSGERVIDVACGTGIVARIAAKREIGDHQCAAAHVNQRAIELAVFVVENAQSGNLARQLFRRRFAIALRHA